MKNLIYLLIISCLVNACNGTASQKKNKKYIEIIPKQKEYHLNDNAFGKVSDLPSGR